MAAIREESAPVELETLKVYEAKFPASPATASLAMSRADAVRLFHAINRSLAGTGENAMTIKGKHLRGAAQHVQRGRGAVTG